MVSFLFPFDISYMMLCYLECCWLLDCVALVLHQRHIKNTIVWSFLRVYLKLTCVVHFTLCTVLRMDENPCLIHTFNFLVSLTVCTCAGKSMLVLRSMGWSNMVASFDDGGGDGWICVQEGMEMAPRWYLLSAGQWWLQSSLGCSPTLVCRMKFLVFCSSTCVSCGNVCNFTFVVFLIFNVVLFSQDFLLFYYIACILWKKIIGLK